MMSSRGSPLLPPGKALMANPVMGSWDVSIANIPRIVALFVPITARSRAPPSARPSMAGHYGDEHVGVILLGIEDAGHATLTNEI
jgi:hypothetical protein